MSTATTQISRISQILLAPLVSEKSTMAGDRENSTAFWVKPDATKAEIAAAVKHFFPEAVIKAVNTSKLHRKFVKRGNTLGRKVARKKAYITLAPGSEIKLNEFES